MGYNLDETPEGIYVHVVTIPDTLGVFVFENYDDARRFADVTGGKAEQSVVIDHHSALDVIADAEAD